MKCFHWNKQIPTSIMVGSEAYLPCCSPEEQSYGFLVSFSTLMSLWLTLRKERELLWNSGLLSKTDNWYSWGTAPFLRHGSFLTPTHLVLHRRLSVYVNWAPPTYSSWEAVLNSSLNYYLHNNKMSFFTCYGYSKDRNYRWFKKKKKKRKSAGGFFIYKTWQQPHLKHVLCYCWNGKSGLVLNI